MNKSIQYAPVVALLLLLVWLGARGLNADMLWWDEHWSLDSIGAAHYGPLSPVGVMERIASKSVWDTPGYYLALNVWGGAVGWTPFALRALSLLFGVLAAAWTYRLGADLGGAQVGLGAAAVLCGSAFFIGYLHELRPYALSVLCAAAFLWAYWRLVTLPDRAGHGVLQDRHGVLQDGRGEPRPYETGAVGTRLASSANIPDQKRLARFGTNAVFVLSAAGLLYSHYFAALVIVPVVLYQVIFARSVSGRHASGVSLQQMVMMLALAGLLFVPWVGVTLNALETAATTEEYVVLSLSTGDSVAMLLFGFSNGLWLPLLLLIPAALTTRRLPGARFAWFALLALLLVALGVNLRLSVIKHLRHLLMLLPLFAVVTGFGAAWLMHRGRAGRITAGGLAALWLAAGIWHSITPAFNDTLFRQEHLDFFRPHLPLNQMANIISDYAQSGDAVIFDAPLHPWAISGAFDYYMHPLPVHYAMTDWLPGAGAAYLEQARRWLADDVRLWFGVEANQPPGERQAAFEQIIAAEFSRCERPLALPDLRLELYARSPLCCAPPETALIDYGTLQLAGAEVAPDAGGVTVLLAWQLAPDAPRGKYSAARHVLDTEGNIVAQADAGLPLEAYRCERTRIDLPPGDYTLNLIVYDWAAGTRLPGQTPDDDAPADSHRIAAFSIP